MGWAAAIAAIAAALVALWPRSESPTFYFAVTIRAASSGVGRLYYGVPFGSAKPDSVALQVNGGNRDVDYKFPLLDGRYLNVRFDPINHAGTNRTLR